MSVTPTGSDSRSSSASSHSSTPTANSLLMHPLPARPLQSRSPDSEPFTPVQPSINLMTPTPPPSMSRPNADTPTLSPFVNKSARRSASPLTSELTNVNNAHIQSYTIQTPLSPSFSSLSLTGDLYAQSQFSSPAPSLNSTTTAKTAYSNDTPNPLQTTNVYINGLPPNFKDEQLYALTSPFGKVLSCRTFTRQLSDRPTGYGFVLFETIEAAQQCINVLRSHHNLHPHFAKGAHKILGRSTVCAPPTSQQTLAQPTMQTGRSDSMDVDDGFPAADIYIEGLPMNVDTQTLTALLAPHTVRSSRFFADTRVRPPQLVAFVRLDSCTAAQDVHDKLHGRTIRGYSGRLQVIIADAGDADAGFARAERVSSGLPASALPYSDPYDFTTRARAQSQSQSQSQLPVDELLHTLQSMSRHAAAPPADVPAPLQPINATLHELQLQLENLRPLLAAYNQPQPHASRTRSLSHVPASTFLSPGPNTVTKPVIISDANANWRAHTRAHTTGHHGAGLGLGPPLFPQGGGGISAAERTVGMGRHMRVQGA